ncbi:MAG: YggS family pyridoxal phosphate-dependent enzyme [Candidatus Gastranaerophilales bacterium]|nr:YggS family pyridoxal phosphate-dependent enzyme [Candidatus Gastranaerophilales bacterium]
MNNVLKNLNKIDVDTSKIRLIAVTKYVDTDKIIEAYEAGIRDFAENRYQDAELKRKNLPPEVDKNIIWHFIGHLQSNKAKKVTGIFDYIHSVDSIKLAKQISEEAKIKDIIQKILIQVNIAEEETKFGFKLESVREVFKEIIKLNSLNVQGFMTIGPNTDDEKVIRKTFKELRELKDNLQENFNYNLPELSMGMSNDYKIAIEEGSTMIRLGQVLFR